MTEQTIFSETGAFALIEDPRFGLGEAWRSPAPARALSCSGPFESAPSLGSAMRAFMSARVTTDEIDRFLKLWTASNALRNHIATRFETAQAMHLRREPGKLPSRYHIKMIDAATIGALAALIDPAHPFPNFGALRSRAFRDAQRALGDMAESLVRECKQNPRGVLAQLAEEPGARAFDKPRAKGAESPTATEELFALAKGLGASPLVFVLLVASYELRNGLIHGSIALPLVPGEQREELAALGLCTLVLDTFLDQALPQTAQQLDAGDGRLAPFPEACRQAIAHYLDHRFDGMGMRGILCKYGLLW